MRLVWAETGSRPGLTGEEQARRESGPGAQDLESEPLPPGAEGRPEERRDKPQLAAARDQAVPGAAADEHRNSSGGAAPAVEVRVGDHGDYERIVFEWPQEIEYEVVQRADQVTVAFSRAGRIDLSPLRAGLGQRVVEVRPAGSEATDRVVLRVVPDAGIRTFSAKGGRIVAIDVHADAATAVVPAPQAEPERDSLQALRAALEQRDAVIEDLLMRVAQLERKVALSSGDLDQVVAGAAAASPTVGGAPLPRPVARGTTVAQAPSSAPAPEPSGPVRSEEPAPANQDEAGGGTEAPAQPGQFEVVEEEIDRALERTLVQTGVLLLPFGQAEIEPSFSYTREEGDSPVLFAAAGGIGAGNQQVRRNEFVTGQTLRVGLPFDSQLELSLPYRYVQQSIRTPTGFGRSRTQDGSGHGLGDLRVGLAKTLLREDGGWWPDLVARVTWDADTGQTTDNDVVLGGGFNELSGSLSAIKRQDPLAFVAGVSYETSFENDHVRPGDELGFNIGTVLAASPSTSLRLALAQNFIDNTRVDGEGINGSDGVAAMATLGASVILGPGVLLDVAADIGLTDDAPEYAIRTSLPIRFNLPAY